LKRTIISSAVLALALAGTGIAAADKPEGKGNGGFKVTGGGQIIAQGAQGAGDTVGFNAHEEEGDNPATDAPNDAARGQFQFVPRGQSGDSAGNEKFHGIVTCLLSGGEAVANEAAEDDDNVEEALTSGQARFGGFLRDNPAQAFTVDVTDNGQGGKAEDDMILVRLTGAPCADNPEDEDNEAEELVRLGRGNVKIHNNPDGAGTFAAATQAAAALARLAR
jgi:hypothetical protein